MRDRFAVGELAIVIRAGKFPQYQGEDCEIVGPLVPRKTVNDEEMTAYLIRMKDGMLFCATPGCLKKKRGPREDLAKVSWKSCVWKPRVTA